MIGAIRELLGAGTLLGISIFGEDYLPWTIMLMPPGGFLAAGFLLVFFAWRKGKKERREVEKANAEAPAEGRVGQ